MCIFSLWDCLSQISSCPVLGVTVDFPSVLEAGGGVLNPCFEKSSLPRRALALVVELSKSLVYINIKTLIKM